MDVFELTKGDEADWTNYVKESPDSTFYHQLGWMNVIEKTYNHKPHYLIAKEDGTVKGILPLFLMKSKLFGCKLVSLPFAPYGGICSKDDTAINALIKKAENLATESNASYLELRYLNCVDSNLLKSDKYFTSILKLNTNSETLWMSFSKKVRNSARKAEKSGVEIISGHEYLNGFYKVYSKNIRDLGTPVHSIDFFENILSEFPESEILIAKYQDKVIAGFFLVYFKDTVISGWAGSLDEYDNLCPNNLLYWTSIKSGCQKGLKYFDFGRSVAGSGVMKFKEAWGVETKQLIYQYSSKNNKIPDTSQTNAKRGKFASIWSKLPLMITNNLGPMLRKNFP